jgi:hypothetical protein
MGRRSLCVLSVADAVDQIVQREPGDARLDSIWLEDGELAGEVGDAQALLAEGASAPQRELLGSLGLAVARLGELAVKTFLDQLAGGVVHGGVDHSVDYSARESGAVRFTALTLGRVRCHG